MATSVVPALIDALVSQLDAAFDGDDVDVYDGYPDLNNIGNALMIGVDDPDSPAAAVGGDSGQTPATSGLPRSRNQTGSITCAATAWDGNGAQKTARDGVYALMAVVENLLRAQVVPPLGVRGLITCEIGDLERLVQNRYTDNAAVDALLIFTVKFTARI